LESASLISTTRSVEVEVEGVEVAFESAPAPGLGVTTFTPRGDFPEEELGDDSGFDRARQDSEETLQKVGVDI
jgi:hypothetical protein